MTSPLTITQLLMKWRDGDQTALDELAPRVYKALRRLAKYYLPQERPHNTWQSSNLVQKANRRLLNEKNVVGRTRAHSFGTAAGGIGGFLSSMREAGRQPNGAGVNFFCR